MTKKIFGLTILLLALLFLPACFVRITGPCLGYGCPTGTSAGSAHATNTRTQPTGQAVAGKNTSPAQPAAIPGK